MKNPIHIPKDVLQELYHLFDQHLTGKVKILLFGSRATGNHRPDSDVDLALSSDEDLSSQIIELNKAISQADLPLDVELIDYQEASEGTLNRIHTEGVVIWNN